MTIALTSPSEIRTPSQLLLTAWRRTPTVMTPSGKTVTYNPPDFTTVEGVCYLCGERGPGYPKKRIIKDTFTDHPWARAKTSDVVCEACGWALSQRPLRNYSLYATLSGLRHPSRAEWRALFLEPPQETPYLACVAVSGQKWMHVKHRLGWRRDIWDVIVEETPVRFEPAKFGAVLEPIEDLLRMGFTREEIRTGNYASHRIQKAGIAAWEAADARIRRQRMSRLFALALMVAEGPKRGGGVV